VPGRMHELAHELCAGSWVATGGGGYDIWRVVPRAWTALWAALSHQELPEKVSESWLSKWSGKSPVRLPLLMRDDPEAYPQGPRVAKIAERNFRTVEDVVEKVLARIQ
jgi:acetoin utilization protein AcuC